MKHEEHVYIAVTLFRWLYLYRHVNSLRFLRQFSLGQFLWGYICCFLLCLYIRLRVDCFPLGWAGNCNTAKRGCTRKTAYRKCRSGSQSISCSYTIVQTATPIVAIAVEVQRRQLWRTAKPNQNMTLEKCALQGELWIRNERAIQLDLTATLR